MIKINSVFAMIGKLIYYLRYDWRKLPTSRVINEYCPDDISPETWDLW